MATIEEKKTFIFEQVGEQGLHILRDCGINVDSIVTSMLQEQAMQQEGLEVQAELGKVNNMMTSELVYKSDSVEDIYGQEFTRRLRGIGLTDKQVLNLYHTEQLILFVDEKLSEDRKKPWVRRGFITSTPETMPEKGVLTLSELVLITDDANSAYWREAHTSSNEEWAAVCMAACCAPCTEARYFHIFEERTEKFGWSYEQDGAYIRNESLLAERLKWNYHEKPAWVAETCDLKQYQRNLDSL